MSFEIFEEVEKTMDTRITELLEEIKKAIDKAATTGDKYQFIDPVFDLTDELEQCETPFDAVRPILELIESSPNIDFGGPGPLGSFMEKFYHEGYEEELVASLKRKPTEYTIALMFRIIADKKNPNLSEYKHLMRGQVFTFGGLTWFTMGGASSHDIRDGILDPKEPDFEQRYWLLRRMRAMFRVKGVSWWAEEMPNSQEYADALSSLDRMNWKVDCILTHCGPSSIVRKIDPSYGSDQLTNFLDMVNQRCQFIYWFFGHYHDNRIIDDRYILQWEQISGLEL